LEDKQETISAMGSETILVAEDEEPVRKLLVRVLEKYGYNVLQAGDGVEGVQKAQDYQGKIDLLLTDTIMPRMNGKQLSDELKKSRSQVKVIFISGYTAEVLSQQGILDSNIHLIQKPFELDYLVKRVRKVLDEAGTV
jgi:DNA-binding response OmpR family regulator